MRHWLGILLSILVHQSVQGQAFSDFQAEYDFYLYLQRERYPDDAFRILQQLETRPGLTSGQRDTVYYAIGRYYYEQQNLVASAASFSEVSRQHPRLWHEAVFFQAFGLAYSGQPYVARSLLAKYEFSDPLYHELSTYQQAGMSLLVRDYATYDSLSNLFTGTYFAFAEEEGNLSQWAIDLQQYQVKKPWVAGTLSALVPGLGRVYAGRWGQGLISFLSIGVLGLQAWEGYRKDGPLSWRFITFATLGSLFYAGNVVGSAYAAQQENDEFYEAVDYRLRLDMHVPLRTLFR